MKRITLVYLRNKYKGIKIVPVRNGRYNFEWQHRSGLIEGHYISPQSIVMNIERTVEQRKR